MLLPTFGTYAQEELTETYTSDLGDITISYPEGWEAVAESGLVILINGDPEIINQQMLPPGTAALVLLPPEFLTLFEVDAGASPVEAIEVLTRLIDQDFEDVGEPENVTLDNDAENEMTFVSVRDEAGDGFIAAIGYEAGTVGVLAFAAPGELEDVEATLRAMLDTLVYQEPQEIPLPEDNAVSWETDTVSLSASNFYIVAGGQVFTADVDEIDVDGDPGDDVATSLEVTWMEHDVEMRVYIYFEADGESWNAYEMRIYDGADPGEWVTFEDELFSAILGEAYSIGVFGRGVGRSTINFNDLEVQAFTSAE
jgi:hypothetical protein